MRFYLGNLLIGLVTAKQWPMPGSFSEAGFCTKVERFFASFYLCLDIMLFNMLP